MKNLLLFLGIFLTAIFLIQFSSSAREHCYPMWNCTSWSECANNLQIRTCYDFNFCENNSRRPNETQSCGIICNPNWQCAEWIPEPCHESKSQNRSCIDQNKCGSLKGMPEEIRACVYHANYAWALAFGIFILVIIILGVLWSLSNRIKKIKEQAPQ